MWIWVIFGDFLGSFLPLIFRGVYVWFDLLVLELPTPNHLSDAGFLLPRVAFIWLFGG